MITSSYVSINLHILWRHVTVSGLNHSSLLEDLYTIENVLNIQEAHGIRAYYRLLIFLMRLSVYTVVTMLLD